MKANELVNLIEAACPEDFENYNPNEWQQVEHNAAYFLKEKGCVDSKEMYKEIQQNEGEVIEAVFGDTLAEKLNAIIECPVDTDLDEELANLVDKILIKSLLKCVPSIEDKVNQLIGE